jgi:hypothetical protein
MGRLATLRQLPRGSPAPGEVMTLAPGSTIATGGVLFDDPHLPKSWWTDLDAALTALAAHPVTMEHELDAVRYPHQRCPASTLGHADPRHLRRPGMGNSACGSALGESVRADAVHSGLGELAAGTRRLRRGNPVPQQPAAPTHGSADPRPASPRNPHRRDRAPIRNLPLLMGSRRGQRSRPG